LVSDCIYIIGSMTHFQVVLYLVAFVVPLLFLLRAYWKGKRDVKITELWIYPIKSCKGTRVNSIELCKYGLKGDREYIIVFQKKPEDKIFRFVTLREHPGLALLAPKLEEKGITLSGLNMEDLFIPKVNVGTMNQIKTFAPEQRGIDQGDEAANWLSKYVGKPCRLMRFPEQQWVRPPEGNSYGIKSATQYADRFPILIVNEASLHAVNMKLPGNVTMANFRPNIVIRGPHAWQECNWETLVTPEGHVLHSVLHCDRCTLPSIDPIHGKRLSYDPRKGCISGLELGLETEDHNKAYFGENIVFEGPDGSRLSVGDILEPTFKEISTIGLENESNYFNTDSIFSSMVSGGCD